MRLKLMFFLLFFILIYSASARVVNFNIEPENPVKGNVVTIYGTASSNELVKIEISFEKTVPVRDGEFVFSIDNVKIPVSRNRFTVTAYGCRDLDVSARRQIIGCIYTPWITLSRKARDGVATISQRVPPGTYDVIIHGKASGKSVRLRIVAVAYIKADSRGRFRFSYDTTPIPPGRFVVSVDGLTKVVNLASESNYASQKTVQPQPTVGGGEEKTTNENVNGSTVSNIAKKNKKILNKKIKMNISKINKTKIKINNKNNKYMNKTNSSKEYENNSIRPSEHPTNESFREHGSGWSIPGFGVFAGVLGLLVAGLIMRKRI